MVKRFIKKYQITNALDLHGIKHSEVYIMVEDFILQHQDHLPLKIITGNSKKMKTIVIDAIQQHRFNYSEGDYYNRGYILVLN